MSTVAEIIEDAAVMSGVLPSGQSLDSERTERFTRWLNEMLDSWANDGIDLGIGSLASGDELYVDAADIRAIKYNLSMTICDLSRKPKDPDIYHEAKRLKTMMLNQHQGEIELEIDVALTQRSTYDINSE